jgi:glycosyltransferase involved in cell wall biosynthesis
MNTDRESAAPRPCGDRSPTVSVVIPTHDRPVLLRRALESVLAQRYDGDLDVLVVFDRTEPDRSLEQDSAGRRVRVLANSRTPGLAGSRNTGVLAARGALVAFCDDDDVWLPGKLERQVRAMAADPDAEFCSTAMLVDYGGRLTHTGAVDHARLVRSRMAMLHSSSFLIDRTALLHGIGLVDETLPQSMAEDWDLLLRAAARRPVLHVDEALVRITWGGTSYFAQQWQVRNESQLWLLEHHPSMRRDRVGAGHAYGKLAFGCAALGRRRESARWVARAVRANWREPRAYVALGVLLGVVRWDRVLAFLNARGHGI